MSFILDALRKSENERRREATPTLTRASYAPPKRPVPMWIWGLIVLLTLTLVVLVASVLFRQGEPGTMQPAPLSAPANDPGSAIDLPAPPPARTQSEVVTSTTVEPDLTAPPRSIDDLRARNPNLPELELEFVAFDSTNADSSSAWIDGRRRYAGDNLGNGVRLAEVRQNSVLLTFEGEVFLLRL